MIRMRIEMVGGGVGREKKIWFLINKLKPPK